MHHVEVVSRLEYPHLEQLPELIEAATRADGHEPIGEHKFLRIQRGDDLAMALLAYAHAPSNHESAREPDARQRLAGYAHALIYGEGESRRVSCEFVVHPEQRRKGIGRLLLAEALTQANEHGARRMDLWAYNDSPASGRVAAHFGFTPVRRLRHLHRHVTSGPDAAGPMDMPAGAQLRSFRPDIDDARWLELNNRIFRGHPENGGWTLDDLRSRIAQPWFNADDLLMLEIDGAPAGFCWLKVEERGESGRVGEIYVIGTAPECRGMGLGRFLLSRALAHLRTRGVALAAIYVDESNVAAVSLYEDAGFHHHHVDVCYTRVLSADGRIDAAA